MSHPFIPSEIINQIVDKYQSKPHHVYRNEAGTAADGIRVMKENGIWVGIDIAESKYYKMNPGIEVRVCFLEETRDPDHDIAFYVGKTLRWSEERIDDAVACFHARMNGEDDSKMGMTYEEVFGPKMEA